MPKNKQKTCFVVMGYGTKTDYQTGRALNLNASYDNMIKPAVEQAGLKCIRADEIQHSGVVDTLMYQQLLEADVVVVDLSTSNPNAFYELGVRHALRPFTTIIIAEDKLVYPFNLNHTVIRRYKHLGEDIGVSDAKKFGTELTASLKEILDKEKNDSPVYTYLKDLQPPSLTAAKVVAAAAQAAVETTETLDAKAASDAKATRTLNALMRQADEAVKGGHFVVARELLSVAREMAKPKDTEREEDPYLIQRLALVTYKSELPTAMKALEEARDLLTALKPDSSNDTETLGLWGAVHKRLWEETGDRRYLDKAIRAYERGFHIRNDYYNAINLAYLLNVRALESASKGEAIADFVQAQRIRQQIIEICHEWLASESPPARRRNVKNTTYWAFATLAEAYLGIGQETEFKKWIKKAYSTSHSNWMKQTTEERINKLSKLLQESPLKGL
jgi:tetratricopeptide (TPR) repeat protein